MTASLILRKLTHPRQTGHGLREYGSIGPPVPLSNGFAIQRCGVVSLAD